MCIFTHFYTHIYMVTGTHIFNILLYFSLSLSLFFLTLHCRRSLFFFLSSRDLSDLSPWWLNDVVVLQSDIPASQNDATVPTSINLIFNQITQNDVVVLQSYLQLDRSKTQRTDRPNLRAIEEEEKFNNPWDQSAKSKSKQATWGSSMRPIYTFST